MNHAQEANVGDRYVLAEEGGYALVEVVHREQTGNSLKFRVRFVEIYIQYPFVPYHVGDEIDISCNLKFLHSGYGWRFETKEEFEDWIPPEMRQTL